MWLCEDKLKGKTGHFRLPSPSQKRTCLSSLLSTSPWYVLTLNIAVVPRPSSLSFQWGWTYREFSRDVTAVMLVYPNNRTIEWCTQLILWELSSIIMQTFCFVSMEKQGYWSREWKHSIQKRDLKIVAPALSYRKALQFLNLHRLDERRNELCVITFKRISKGGDVLNIFLRRGNAGNYVIPKCRTERLLCSFLPSTILTLTGRVLSRE